MTTSNGYIAFSEGLYKHWGRVLFPDLYFGWLAQLDETEEHY